MTKPVTRKMAVDCLLWIARDFRAKFSKNVVPIVPVFECLECFEPILPEQEIQFDHRHADIFDGPHEYQNLRPIHTECHKKKTGRDIRANAKIKRIRGLTCTGPTKKIPSRKLVSNAKFPKRSFTRAGRVGT